MAESSLESGKPWVVRDVDWYVRHTVKVFAVEHNVSIARALEQIVMVGTDKDAIEFWVNKKHEETVRNTGKQLKKLPPIEVRGAEALRIHGEYRQANDDDESQD